MSTYRLDPNEVAYQLMVFVAREVNFRVTYLGETHKQIAEASEVHPQTLLKMCNGTTKSPMVRTLFSLLTTLGFEFDVIKSEVSENVVPLEIGKQRDQRKKEAR